jgi:outer membrane translocation and assembly module TamA
MLLDGLADRGFPDATLTGGADVDLATHRAVVWWRVHPGASVRFGPVRIQGLDGRSEGLVRGELTVQPGAPYSQRELERSQRRLADLGIFRSVLLKPLSSAGDEDLSADRERSMSSTPETTLVRPILVQLEGRPLHSVKLGLGYGTEDRLRVQAGWLHRDLLGRADTLQLTGRYSSLLSEFSADLREPRILERDVTLGVSSSLRRDELPAYDAVELTGNVFLERALRRGWSWRAGYTMEWSNVLDVPDVAQSLLEDPERRTRVSALQLALRRITTDDLLDPRRGTWLELAVEPAARWLGSDVAYLRATLDARGFLPLGPTVLAGRAYLGTIDALAGTRQGELPVTKLFYAGGSTLMRGYGFQRLGLPGAEGKPVGGSSLATGSLELRFPLWRALGGVTFVEAGELARTAWSWRPSDLLFDAGVGLRVRTPLGPVRLDVGVPLNPPADTQRWRVWLSIGHAF